jgi:DNA adenine methylase
MDPMLRWPGGKTRLLNYILPKIDIHSKGRYIEPFLGGGSVFFALEPKRAIIADLCKPLISFYEAIQREPNAVLQEMAGLISSNFTQNNYYNLRSQFNYNDFGVKFAARLWYLNKTGFNGLFRLNNSLEYNVPWGNKKKAPTLPEHYKINIMSELLNRTKLYCRDYRETVKLAKRNDFIYLDPPYWHTYSGYTGFGFTNKQQLELATTLKRLSRRGVRILASNIDCEEVRKAYKWAHIEEIKLKHQIGAKTESRRKVTEVLIMA